MFRLIMELSSLSLERAVAGTGPSKVGLACFTVTQCLLLGGVLAAPASPPVSDVAVRQAESLKQKQAQAPAAPSADEPPETYPGENQDLGPQMLLKKKKVKALFEFSSDTMFSWTSNAFSSSVNPREAGIVAETFSLALAPEPVDLGPGKAGVRAGYRHLLWMYDAAKVGHARSVNGTEYGSLNGSNFEMSTFFVGANYSFAENWNASLGVDFNRIMNDEKLDASGIEATFNEGKDSTPSEWSLGRMIDYSKWQEIYSEWNPNWALFRNVSVSDKINLSVSYSGSYHFTTTDPAPTGPRRTNPADKLDNGVTVSVTFAPLEKVIVQPNVRLSHSLYTQPQTTQSLRRDRGVTPGLTVMYMPSPRVSLRGVVSADFRHCNDQDLSPNSSKLDASIGVSLTLKF